MRYRLFIVIQLIMPLLIGSAVWPTAAQSPDNLLQNSSFEEGLTAWQQLTQNQGDCQLTVLKDSTIAKQGDSLLAARGSADCISIYQSVPQPLTVGQSYRFAIWIRAASAAVPLEGRVALWEEGAGGHYNQDTKFAVTTVWHCVETELRINQAVNNRIKPEIYLDSFTHAPTYYLDQAVLRKGGEPICPQTSYELISYYPSARYFTLSNIETYELKLRNLTNQSWRRHATNGCALHLKHGYAYYHTSESYDQLKLGQVSPLYQAGYDGWLENSPLGPNGSRVVMVEEQVAPGEIATFRFQARVPGIKQEELTEQWIPILEGATCPTPTELSGPTISFKMLIYGYQAKFYSQLPQGRIKMAPGEVREIWVKFWNKNELPWPSELTRLGTVHPQENTEDYPSPFYHTSWENDHRPCTFIAKTEKLANESYGIATCRFTIQAPQQTGQYKFRVRPLVEHVQWMGAHAMDVSWEITVSDAEKPVPVPAQTFGPPKTFGSLTDDSQAVATGDINGDGFIDVVVGHQQAQNSLYLNDGQGRLRLAQSFGATDGLSNDVAVADLNNDGWLDVLVANQGHNRIHLNEGAGQLEGVGREFGAAAANSHALAVGDWDNDGWLDLAVSNVAGQSYRYRNNQHGHVEAGQPLGTPSWPSQAIALADLNADKQLDILMGNNGYHNYLFLNQNGATFDGGFDFDKSIHNAVAVAVADLDGDNQLDIVVGNVSQKSALFINGGQANGRPSFFHDEATDLPTQAQAVAAGDLNNDGTIDLVTGLNGGQNQCWLNNGHAQFPTHCNVGTGQDKTTAVALADLNQDSFLDVIVVNQNQPNAVYLNQGGGRFQAQSRTYFGTETATTDLVAADFNQDGRLDFINSRGALYLNNGQPPANWLTPTLNLTARGHLAVADLNGDNRLDLVASNGLFFNQGAGPSFTARPFGKPLAATTVAVADLDGDSDVDLVAGYDSALMVYLNDGQGSYHVGQVDCAAPPDNVICLSGSPGADRVAIGDVNGDGLLDLVVSQRGAQNQLYLNRGHHQFSPLPFGRAETDSRSLAVGDVNQDGSLDIVVGNGSGQPNYLYLNNGRGQFDNAASQVVGTGADSTSAIVLADLTGDRRLDMVVANDSWQPNLIYLNDAVTPFQTAYHIGAALKSKAIAVGDFNHDGTLDLLEGNDAALDGLYLNPTGHPAAQANNPPRLILKQPGRTGRATTFAQHEILATPLITIPYTLFDDERDPIGWVQGYYSLNGGGQWWPATPTTTTVTRTLSSAITGTSHVYGWNVAQDGLFGLYDNVLFRLDAYPNRLQSQWPYVTAATSPFRVRGTQVRVVDTAGAPVSKAQLYRLSVTQTVGGQLLTDATGQPFLTNEQGYLTGNGAINLGDQLLALAPYLTATHNLTWSNNITVYMTNGQPITEGVEGFTVREPGVQTLVVSTEKPLVLVDLWISLEWDDSHNVDNYIGQLARDALIVSDYLYDFTNGQVALGKITLYQNADYWGSADVLIQATNAMRPIAVQGGVVITTVVDPNPALNIEYSSGGIRMGSRWNRHGVAGRENRADWRKALAHELSHYLFFLDDVYLGLDDEGRLIPMDSCTGSAMGDLYVDPKQTEFIADESHWLTHCTNTLAHRTLGRTEWDTLRLWYPWLNKPTHIQPGPNKLPYQLTQVTITPPLTPTTYPAEAGMYIIYQQPEARSSGVQAYLFKPDMVIDLGQPIAGDRNELAIVGAAVGDRLCVFDPAQQHYGCEVLAKGDEELYLKQDHRWTPQIQISPVTSQTFDIEVAGLVEHDLPLSAVIYPEFARPTAPINLKYEATSQTYRGQITHDTPALRGYVQLYVNEPTTETNPRREVVSHYLIGGNAGRWSASRHSGPASRHSGPASRHSGTAARSGNAPLASPDGGMIYFTENPIFFAEGELYTVQTVSSLPQAPSGKTVIGRGYNLVASPTVSRVLTGSISFQYLTSHIQQVNQLTEDDLAIHFWDGQQWRRLDTEINKTHNLASTNSQGSGIYALMGGNSTPDIVSYHPHSLTNELTHSLMITAVNLVRPVAVQLVGLAISHTLPVQQLTVQQGITNTLRVTVPAGLPPAPYQLQLSNQLDHRASTGQPLPIYAFAAACFYDFFESGLSRWQKNGQWDVVRLSNGQQVLSDSPHSPYSAIAGRQYLTSTRFSLLGCPEPTIVLQHEYQLMPGDVARLEISADAGQQWHELQTFKGQRSNTGSRQQPLEQEWTDVTRHQLIPIPARYQQAETVQLRLSLQTNNDGQASKGWVIDSLLIPTERVLRSVYLPLLKRD